MAGSRYAYVRSFELPDPVLPNTFMVIRIDGKGFHKFSEAHDFAKPNDAPALELMNEAARHVMNELKGQVVLAFGESDEFSFLLKRSCTLYNRRESKLVTHVVSLFTGAYVYHWARFFPQTPLRTPPSFDGRLVMYPSPREVRDYFSWRQADTHINNLYNTTFWALIQKGGSTEREAHDALRGTVSADKHEILYGRFGINYDRLPAMFRKGTTIVWADAEPATTAAVAAVPSSSSASSSMGAESASNSKGAVHAGPSPSLNSSGTPIHPLLDISRSSSVPGSPAPAKTAASTPFSNGKKNSATGKGAVKAAPTKTKRVLRTLYIDIIGDEFWTPASASEAAPASAPMSAAAVSASSSGRDRTGEEEDEERRKVQGDTDKEGEEQETEQEGITSEPWEDEQRLNGQGLGYGLLDD